MWKWIALFVTSLMVGCAPSPSIWPARVRSMNNFSPEHEARVWAAIEKLNALSSVPIISDDGHYPIDITLVAPNPDFASRVGFAVRRGVGCTVELNSEMFTQQRWDLMDAVFAHEVGHCGGLGHNPDTSSLMAKYTTNFSQYTDTALDNFILDLIAITGLVDGNSPGLVTPAVNFISAGHFGWAGQ